MPTSSADSERRRPRHRGDDLPGTGVEITVVEPNLAATRLGAAMEPAPGSKLLEPEEVAEAVVGAIERPRFELSVPREIGPALRFRSLLPPRARDTLNRALGMDKVATDVRSEERAPTRARSRVRPPAQHDPTPRRSRSSSSRTQHRPVAEKPGMPVAGQTRAPARRPDLLRLSEMPSRA